MRWRVMRLVGFAWILTVISVGATACSGEDADSTVAHNDPVVTNTDAMTPASDPEPTTTAPTSADGPVVYVAMGDSINSSPGHPDGVVWQYAERLEERFGVEVDLRNWVFKGVSTSQLLDYLDSNPNLRADLAEADVVTTDIPIRVWVSPLRIAGGWDEEDPTACGGDDNQQCLREALEEYKADTDAIIDTVVSLCRSDAQIRLLDVYMLKTGFKLEAGTLDTVNPYWKAGMDHIEESAERYGIPVAHVYDAFMGPSGTDDPYTKGLLADDQLHPNAQGASLIAQLLDELDS